MPQMETIKPHRSTRIGGCWTCRIRHKKCDEHHPICDECGKRGLKCHGYGEKPIWIDGGPQEARERASIKSAVKQYQKRAKSSRIMNDANHEFNAMTDKSSQEIQDDLGESSHLSDSNLEDIHSMSNPNSNQPTSTHPTKPTITFQEADLLMHYLDHVFPLQFPYHFRNPSTSRGWLLWLLIKCEPLNQVALSLSALHQYSMCATDTATYQRRDELYVRHVRAIQEVQLFLGRSIKGGSGVLDKQLLVELLACGTSLVSFEVFRGGTGDWEPHLKGLASALQTSTTPSFHQDSNSLNSSTSAQSPSWVENAYSYLASVVLWFEVLSCVSTGREPNPSYAIWLRDPQIDISLVAGCQNWVMEEIGNLASLEVWKRGITNLEEGTDGRVEDLVARGKEIGERLESGLRNLDGFNLRHPTSEIHAVTRIYALAALIQLHTILPSPSSTSSLAITLTLALSALTTLSSTTSQHLKIRGLIWPLCIISCMAEEPHHRAQLEELVKRELSEPPAPPAGFGNLEAVWSVVRACWAGRAREGGAYAYRWREAMAELGSCVLLI